MGLGSQLKRLTKDTFSYGISSALQKLITFFLFPIYARLLTPTDFGVQDVLQTITYIISLFLILGLDSGVLLYYYEANEEDKVKMTSSFLWFEIVVSVPVVVLVVAFASYICASFFGDPDLAIYLQIAVASVPFSLSVGAMLSTLRLTFQTRKFVMLTTIGVLFQIITAILLVIVLRMGIKGVLLSILISNLLQCIFGALLTYKYYSLQFSGAWLIKLLKVGIPLIPAALSFWIMGYANRFFLVKYSEMEEIGVLSVVNRLTSILLLFLSAFSSAWGPYAYSIASDKELASATYSKVFTYFTFFSMVAALLLSLFARELILILTTTAYEQGAYLIFINAISSISWVALYIVGIGTGIAKKNYHYSIAVIGGAFVNTLLNFLLIPFISITGAALATLAGNLFATVYMYWAGQKYFYVKYDFTRVLGTILLSTSIAILGLWIDSRYGIWSSANAFFKVLLFFGFVVLSFIFRITNMDNVRQLIALVISKFKK